MDVPSSTQRLSSLGPGPNLTPYITIVVLITGVVGGLVLVISVILFCKYCIKKKKVLIRQSALTVLRPPSYVLYTHYDTVESSSDTPKVKFSSDTKLDKSDEEYPDDLPDEDCNIDMAVAMYKESIQGEERLESVISDKPLETDVDAKSNYVLLNGCPRYSDGDTRQRKSLNGERPKQRPLLSDKVSKHKTDELSSNGAYAGSAPAAASPEPPARPLSDEESPSPESGSKTHRTEVAVEVHRVASSGSGSSKSESQARMANPPKILEPALFQTNRAKHSHSLEIVSPTECLSVRCARRVKSYEGEPYAYRNSVVDYDRHDITQFIRGPFYNADYDVISDGHSPELQSKVRYNDTGSFEEVNDVDLLGEIDVDEGTLESSDDAETLKGTLKYRELWNLRASLANDDDDFSDTIQMEDYSSAEDHSSEEREHVSTATSYDSCGDPGDAHRGGRGRSGSVHGGTVVKLASANLLHPNYESRRQTYRSILSKRLKRIEAPGSTDNSFDSIETMDTDGEMSDTSRHEVTTTSFESTTDNTDSTGETATHKLQQMRGDSGYKSLETQQSITPVTPPRERSDPKQIQFQLMTDQGIAVDLHSPEDPKLQRDPTNGSCTDGGGRSPVQKKTTLERRNGKTASKKRKEYSRERQIGHIYESLETDSKSDHFSGDSFDEGHTQSKLTLFTRFFKTSREKQVTLTRDYSIDERTNAIYNQFMKYDPKFDPNQSLSVRRPHMYGRHRLHRKRTESLIEYDSRRRDKLRPEVRSASLGSDSSTSSLRRTSPQDDSIEEEYNRRSGTEQIEKNRRYWTDTYKKSPPKGSIHIHEIPIIKLPEGEPAKFK